MSLLQWPAGWRFPGRPEPVTRCRPAQPVHGARPLDTWDMAMIYGPTLHARSACMNGHELVTWHGEDPCFACGGPGIRRDA